MKTAILAGPAKKDHPHTGVFSTETAGTQKLSWDPKSGSARRLGSSDEAGKACDWSAFDVISTEFERTPTNSPGCSLPSFFSDPLLVTWLCWNGQGNRKAGWWRFCLFQDALKFRIPNRLHSLGMDKPGLKPKNLRLGWLGTAKLDEPRKGSAA